MNLSKIKLLVIFIAIGFAILQALQPFIHAHLDSQHPIQNTGFHVGNEHEELIQNSSNSGDHLSMVAPHASHTISVASGIKKDINFALANEAFQLVLFCLCFAIVLLVASNIFLPLVTHPYQSLKKRLPASRAPPQF